MINITYKITNKLISRFALATLLIAGPGCDDLLTEKPRTFLAQDVVFQTVDGAVSATTGIYKPLGSTDLYGWWLLGCMELFSDYINGRGSQAPLGDYQLDATSIQRIGFIWRGAYQIINRANIVIDRLEHQTIPGMSAEMNNRLIGEARFLRALSYFHLVRLFGEVPLRLQPENDTRNLAIPRSPVSAVYEQIIEDLEFGETHLPESYPASEIGRATTWAAKGILAEVYLTLEHWEPAASKAGEIMDKGPFRLLEVSAPEDFQLMFGPDVLTHPEEIFSIKHATVPGLGFEALWLMHRAGSGYSLGNNAHAWMGNLDSWLGDWIEALDGPDLRPKDWLYNGPHDEQFLSNEVPMLFKKFRDTQSDNPGNDFPIIRYTEVVFIFAEANCMANGEPTAEAYEAINSIRRRAYGKTPHTPDPVADLPTGLSAQEFRNELMLERAKEFVMEGKRWYDLLRTGTALDVIQALGKPIQEKHLKWPIPAEEIDNNEALGQENQNPGW